jgi:hypothetical protein
MRTWSLISLLLVSTGCTVRVPTTFRARGALDVNVNARVRVQAPTTVQIQARPIPLLPPPPPPPPAPVVEIRNAPVVEFFGIPLEGATDVVFVLDCSGSMDELARGRIAELAPVAPAPDPSAAPGPPPAPQEPPGPPPATGPGEPMPPQPVTDPNTTPSTGEPAPPGSTDPNAVATEPAPVVQQHRPRKIEVAQVELVEALRRLPTGTNMNVLFFNDGVDGYAPTLVPLQDAGREGLITFVNESVPTGKTALVPAMRVAFLMNAKRIVLLSDGLGNVGGGSNVLLEDMREAIRGGVRVDAIGIGDDQDAPLLQSLAEESGGLYQGL